MKVSTIAVSPDNSYIATGYVKKWIKVIVD
jgi:hypothetical protein